MDNFRSGKTWVLVATDLIGRGMDFLGVNTVINYDFPQVGLAAGSGGGGGVRGVSWGGARGLGWAGLAGRSPLALPATNC